MIAPLMPKGKFYWKNLKERRTTWCYEVPDLHPVSCSVVAVYRVPLWSLQWIWQKGLWESHRDHCCRFQQQVSDSSCHDVWQIVCFYSLSKQETRRRAFPVCTVKKELYSNIPFSHVWLLNTWVMFEFRFELCIQCGRAVVPAVSSVFRQVWFIINYTDSLVRSSSAITGSWFVAFVWFLVTKKIKRFAFELITILIVFML